MSEYKLVCDIALDNERFRVWGFAGKESADMAALKEYIIDMSNSSYQSTSGLLCADVSQLREEIVRCDSCKYYDERESSEVYPHRHWCDKLTVYMPPDGFCSSGE